MHAWSRLSEVDDVAKRVFLAPSQGHFDWASWWKLSHTDSRLVLPGREAAFALFHFMGMVGVSEARAESIASLLKRYRGTHSLSTDRIVEQTLCEKLWSGRFDLRRCILVEMLGGILRRNAEGQVLLPAPGRETESTEVPFERGV